MDLEQLKQAMTGPAATLLGIQRVAGNDIRKKSLEAYGRLTEANLLVTGVIASALLRTNGRASNDRQEHATHDCSGLIASFIIGLEPTENAISEGRYLQASALVRQELETLAALEEIKQGRRMDRKTPSVGTLEQSLRRLYDDLSAAAHVSRRDLVAAATTYSGSLPNMPQEIVVRRYIPALDAEVARKLYAVHTLMTIFIAQHLGTHQEEAYQQGLVDDEIRALNAAIEMMVVEKMCTSDDIPA